MLFKTAVKKSPVTTMETIAQLLVGPEFCFCHQQEEEEEEAGIEVVLEVLADLKIIIYI